MFILRYDVTNNNILYTGQYLVPGATLYGPSVSGPGTRVQWYSQKAALLVGPVGNNACDEPNIGIHSIGMAQVLWQKVNIVLV